MDFGVHQTRFSRNLLSLQKNIDKFENIKIRNDFLINLGYTNNNNLTVKILVTLQRSLQEKQLTMI